MNHRFLQPVPFDQLTMPTLLLHGSRTHAFSTNVVNRLTDQLTDPYVREIDGTGHLDQVVAAEAVAAELIRVHEAAPVRIMELTPTERSLPLLHSLAV